MNQMGETKNPDSESTKDQIDALKKLKTDIWGSMYADHIPTELADEFLRQKVGVPHHVWVDDELYPPRRKGRLAAAQIIQNYRELVTRVQDTLIRNREKLKRAQLKKKTGSPQKRSKKARRSNYRRKRR